VPFSSTNLRVIAKSIVKILTDPNAYEDSKNKYVYLASHTTTQAEILAAAEKATGKKFEVTKLDGQKVLAESKEALGKGDFSVIRNLIQAVAFAKINGDNLSDFRGLGIFNEKHGIKDVSLEEDVKALVA
jgi:hypothetical protein